MSKQDFMKIQSCVLKVSIHCDGCKQKVRKLLQKIEGVYSVSIDSEQGKVIVSGNVDPFMLIEKLVKSGKHAELWGGGNKDKKGLNNFQNYGGNMKIEKGNNNGGKDNSKSKKNGGQQQVQQVKGFKDLKVKHGNEQKSVKFKLPEEEFDGSDDDFDDEDYDDEFSDDDDDDEFGHGHGHNLRNGSHGSGNMTNMINRFPMNDKKGVAGAGVGGDGGGGKGKKGDVFDFPIVMKGMGDKNDKKGKGGKKGGGGGGGAGGEKNKKGGNKKEGCKEKHGGGGAGGLISKVVGGLLGHGKNGKSEKKDSGKVGAGGNKNGKGGKKGGGKTDGGHEKNKSKQQNFHEIEVTKPTKGGSGAGGKMGFMDQMGGQMGRSPAVQGLPAQATTMNGGGYYQGMGHGLQGMPSPAPAMMPAMGGGGGGGGYYYQGMGLGNPYTQNQQQQYMGMMMNQQMMMDGRAHHQFHPHPAPVNYGGMMAAPPQQHPMADPYTHYFSDENTGSCNIM